MPINTDTDIQNYNKLSDDEPMIPLQSLLKNEICIPEHLVPSVKMLEDTATDGTIKFITEILKDITP